MRLKAFEYIVLEHPEDEDTRFVGEWSYLLAADSKAATFKILQDLQEEEQEFDIDRCEIIVREFVGFAGGTIVWNNAVDTGVR